MIHEREKQLLYKHLCSPEVLYARTQRVLFPAGEGINDAVFREPDCLASLGAPVGQICKALRHVCLYPLDIERSRLPTGLPVSTDCCNYFSHVRRIILVPGTCFVAIFVLCVSHVGSNECSLFIGKLMGFTYNLFLRKLTDAQSGYHTPCSARRGGKGYPAKLTIDAFDLCQRTAPATGCGRERDHESAPPSLALARSAERPHSDNTLPGKNKTRPYLGRAYFETSSTDERPQSENTQPRKKQARFYLALWYRDMYKQHQLFVKIAA